MTQDQEQSTLSVQNSQDQIQGAHLSFKIVKKPHCVIEYEVEVQNSLVHTALEKAVRTVGKELMVPGFRKGKAPAELVFKRYPQEVDRKWQDAIADLAFKECNTLAKIPLLRRDTTISYRMHEHSKAGAKLTLVFETVPELPSIDPKSFQPKEIKRPDVNEEKIEETLRQARLFFAEWKSVEDRPIQEGDFVILDVDVLEGPKERLFTGTRFEVTDKSMAKWMKEIVLGKKAGDSAEGVSRPDENLSEEEKKDFPPKKVAVHIRTIETATLPELDDQFARQIGADSVTQLRERIETLLHNQADGHVREQMREQVTEFLLKEYPFDLPQSTIQKETQFRMQQLMEDPQFKQQWANMSEDERRNMIRTLMAQSDKAVRMFYLCKKILGEAKIPVTGEDIPAAATEPLEALLQSGKAMHDPRQPEIKQAETFSRILIEKATDWILAQNSSSS